ncbi:MAG: hypothetical protein KIG16_02775 [Eubacteriales bacterium]|nr:hypothetical protein [Eubacteriales bacterium]
MDRYNLIIIGFIAATALLALWWTFNTIRRIDNQKNYCAVQLTSMAKLWRKAKFVPEDAKERESLYLYRDFLHKFDQDDGQYPVMVKDGKVRCMTRKEYDRLVGQKDIPVVSPLITIVSVILAAGSVGVNLFITETKNPLLGVGLAAIMPVLQIVLAFFVYRFNKEKNNYRDGIFMALKENSVAFLSIAKPFIVVDAYPEKFGKNKKPLYVTVGELTQKQVIEVRDYIIRQKEAETKVVMSGVDNEREIIRLTEKTTPQPVAVNASDVVSEENAAAEPVMSEPVATPVSEPSPVTTAEPTEDDDLLSVDRVNLLNKFADNIMIGEVKRAVRAAKKNVQAEVVEPVEKLKPLPVEPSEVQAPAEDDFSLEAIGQALDAEIARRNKKK